MLNDFGMSEISGLHFQPWIGKEYDSKGELLLLGESHYMDESPTDDDDFSTGYGDYTIGVIKDNFLAGKHMDTPFFKNIGLLFYPDDYSKIWNEISFANLIQIGLPKAKSQPTYNEIKTIGPAFELLLNNLRPNKVLVLSQRMWKHWIPENNGVFISHIEENGKKSTIWEFNYLHGKCLAMGINHPSWLFGESLLQWKVVIDKFLMM